MSNGVSSGLPGSGLINSWSDVPYDQSMIGALTDSGPPPFMTPAPLAVETKGWIASGNDAPIPMVIPTTRGGGFDASRITGMSMGAQSDPSDAMAVDYKSNLKHAKSLLKLSAGGAEEQEEDDDTSPPDSPEHKPKKRKTKKRARADSMTSDVSRVTLSRDALLRVSSRELEEFAAKAASEKPLTTEEQREIKRQRRLIKNREYAQASRVKKKAFVGDLAKQQRDLEDENNDLRTQLQLANQRIEELMQENIQLKNRLHSSVPLIPPGLSNGTLPPLPGISSSQLGIGLGLGSSIGELKMSAIGIGNSGIYPSDFSVSHDHLGGGPIGQAPLPRFGKSANQR